MARATLTRVYISVELEDGTILEDLRVTVADQARYSRSARVNRWDREDAVRQNTFLAWSSAERQGKTAMSFEDWERALVDLDSASIPADEDTANPTEDSTN